MQKIEASTSSTPLLSERANQHLQDDIPIPPPHFSDKLYTNYIPNSKEISEIKQYVTKVNEELSAYDAHIAELETALQAMTSKRSQLSEIGTAYAALIAPFRRLPPEILQMIFVFCLPPNRNAVMHASEAPVLLGRVCSEWRRISLATPEVWASLHIVPPTVNFSNPTSSTARFQRKRELIQMWLGRSGACPLSISFVWFAGDSEQEIKLCGTLLEVLVPLCSRWKILDFQVPLKMFKPFVGLTVRDVPIMEGLSLLDNRTPFDTESVDQWPESLNFAESATELRIFSLTFFSGGIRLPSIPWSNLTCLYLESNIAFFFPDLREMLNSLSACVNLQSCTLKFPLSHTTSLPVYEKIDKLITLPQLQVLCLDGDQHLHNTFHMSGTLMNMVTPKLRKLEILGRSGRPDGNLAPEPLSAMRTLLARSKCPLERLTVESITILPHEFIDCLKLVPSLVDLVVHNWALRIPGHSLVQVNPGSADEEQQEGTGPDMGSTTTTHTVTMQRPSDESSVEVPENVILKALTFKGEQPEKGDIEAAKNTEESHRSWSSSGSSIVPSSSNASIADDDLLLCPRLQRFDFTLCDASQSLLCDFISSRWGDNIPQGVSKIKSVKCNFTAFEDELVKQKMQQFRSEGLDAFVNFQAPINDDLNPSPWTGLEGPP